MEQNCPSLCYSTLPLPQPSHICVATKTLGHFNPMTIVQSNRCPFVRQQSHFVIFSGWIIVSYGKMPQKLFYSFTSSRQSITRIEAATSEPLQLAMAGIQGIDLKLKPALTL